MAEERNLTKIDDETLNSIGTDAAETTETAVEPTKEELHQRMEQARDSISQTVSELKDTVSTRVEEISDGISRSLDWREYVTERPLTFSVGALVLGFAVGALLGGAGEPRTISRREIYADSESDEFYKSAGVTKPQKVNASPSLYQKVTESGAFQRLQSEAGKIGDRLVDEAVTVGNETLVPAVINKLREVIEEIVPPEKTPSDSSRSIKASTKAATASEKPAAPPAAAVESAENAENDDENNLAQSKTNTVY